MITFSYSLFAKLLYRYANIPVTIILTIHLISSFFMLSESWYFIFPLIINLFVLVLLNRFYIKSYSKYPFKIEADNEKMICSDYFFSTKKTIIYHSDISEIKGGMFSGNFTRPIYIIERKNNETIGFHAHIRGFNKLLTIIMSNIDKDLYQSLLKKMTELGKEKVRKSRKRKG